MPYYSKLNRKEETKMKISLDYDLEGMLGIFYTFLFSVITAFIRFVWPRPNWGIMDCFFFVLGLQFLMASIIVIANLFFNRSHNLFQGIWTIETVKPSACGKELLTITMMPYGDVKYPHSHVIWDISKDSSWLTTLKPNNQVQFKTRKKIFLRAPQTWEEQYNISQVS